jgi:[acyl-carrier-protein] S-malonyltransferase
LSAPVAFLYPGQGSQAVGMGKLLHSQFASAREVFAQADDVLKFPLSQLCFEGPAERLTLTENTQPALVTVSAALTAVLREELGLEPTWAAGHSLGEFSALVAAGGLTFADALKLVRERGRAMQKAGPAGVGSMAALLGLDLATVEEVCRDAADGQIVSPANLNGAGQIVIAGHREAVDRAVELAKARGAKRAVPLTVSAPFHCALMQPAADHLVAILEDVTIGTLRCPVISNVEAKPNTDPLRVKELLVRQVVSPVRWEECVQALAAAGCSAALEVGPGKVLSGLAKRIAPEIRCASAEDLEQARTLVQAA